MTKKLLALYGLKWNPFAPDVPVEAGASVLRMLDLRPEGQEGLSRPDGGDGPPRSSRDPAPDGKAAQR